MKTNSTVGSGFAGGTCQGSAVRAFRASTRAFSLVEMLGVMAILMIMCLAIMPALMRQIALAGQDAERNNLQQMAGALENYVLNNRLVPGTGTQPGAGSVVFTNIASQLGWPIALLLTNATGSPRYYLVDPDIAVGTNTLTKLHYVQTNHFAACTNLPGGARALLITSLAGALPTVLTNPLNLTGSVFDQVWDGPDYTAPAGWSYGGDWANILVQRLNFSKLFVKVILNNHSTGAGGFSLDNTNAPISLANFGQTNFSGWLLLRTVVGLHDRNGALQVSQVLQDATTNLYNSMPGYAPCFTYDRDVWRGRAFASSDVQSRTSLDLQAACDLFQSGWRNTNVVNTNLFNQVTVTSNLWAFMSNYVNWATNFSNATWSNGVVRAQTNLAYTLANYCRTNAKSP